MKSPATLHPDATTLNSFALGRLSDAESLPIEEHLATCVTCRDRIETAPADSLMTRVQAVAAGGSTSPAGRTVGGYELGPEIGRGGMGIVYRARQIGLDRVVALKMLRDGLAAHAGDRARFRAEAGAVSRLRHPNIVQIYEVGEREGQPFLALEFVDGGSLDRSLAGQPLTPSHAAPLVETLARAVHYAHTQGVVHRDLKPANILLAGNGELGTGSRGKEVAKQQPPFPIPDSLLPKITDFGLAKLLDSSDGPTRTGEILGTPSYMAPEQAGGHAGSVGPATDVYALGAILYECLTGRPPFRAATILETLEQVRTEEPVPPQVLQPRVPRDLNTIVLTCLRKEPEKRYADSATLADDLHRWQAGEPILARPAGPVERLFKWARRRPTAAALVVVGALSVGLAIAGVWMHNARLEVEIGRTDKAARDALQQQERAVAHYREARETLRRFLDRGLPSKWQSKTHPSEIYLAQVEEALTFYRAALRSDDADPEVKRDMAYAHLTAATAQALRGQSDGGRANMQAARALLEPLHAADPADLLTCRNLAVCYNALAHTESQADVGIDYRRKAVALRERLMLEDVGDEHRASAWAEAIHNLGASLQTAGRGTEAEAQYRKATDLWRDLRRTKSDVYTTMSLAESQINLALFLQQPPSRLDAATALYQEADDLLRPIVDDPARGAEVATSLAIAYLNWSNIHSFAGRSSEAMDLLTRAAELLDKALQREPKWLAARENRAKVYGSRAKLYHQRGQLKEALADWDQALTDATSDNMRKIVQYARATLLTRLGDHAAAAATAAELSRLPNLTGDDLYNLACTLALSITPALADKALDENERTRRTDDYAKQALQLLESARTAGFFRDPRTVQHLAADPDLQSLRSRPDWRDFERKLNPPK